ncbi:uncharacterized protein LOC143684797 isoform X2 [Tamandua tetradactyla]|uniref:uncharacterized protein LOC143684797 isoform X2 n=1 Tax=Tamandua tetradactyla TaxID=48850 RepID=UPI004053B75E
MDANASGQEPKCRNWSWQSSSRQRSEFSSWQIAVQGEVLGEDLGDSLLGDKECPHPTPSSVVRTTARTPNCPSSQVWDYRAGNEKQTVYLHDPEMMFLLKLYTPGNLLAIIVFS